MTDRELMQQVLDALELAAKEIYCAQDDDRIGIARKTLRARLAQPEQPQRGWKGLTATERKVLWIAANNPAEFGELLEAKLKERNT